MTATVKFPSVNHVGLLNVAVELPGKRSGNQDASKDAKSSGTEQAPSDDGLSSESRSP